MKTLATRSEPLVQDSRIRIWMETGPAPSGQSGIVSVLRAAWLSPEGLSIGERVVDRTSQRGGARSQRSIDLLHRVARLTYQPRAAAIVAELPAPSSTL